MGRKNFELRELTTVKKAAVLIPIMGIILIAILEITEKGNEPTLERMEEGENEVRITAIGEETETTIDLKILPRVESEEECNALYEEFVNKLKQTILAENDSFDEIRTHLVFPEELEGYPFYVSYKVGSRDYISGNGEIIKQPENSIPIEIELTVSCEYFENEEIITGCLINTENREERFERKVREYLTEKNETNRTEDNFDLGEYIDGQSISWKVEKKSSIPKVLALCILAEGALFIENKAKKRENTKKRKEKIREDYPEFAVKYSLLYSAGLPPIRALERIAADAQRRGKVGPLYEELNIVLHENESGISASEALVKMAASCDSDEVKYFCGLICQNMRKGGKDIAKDIKKAAIESEKMRRDEFRKKAETAGTRLTVPMVILLVIVFVLIMYPAFTQFSF